MTQACERCRRRIAGQGLSRLESHARGVRIHGISPFLSED
jgi:hypothetical protein